MQSLSYSLWSTREEAFDLRIHWISLDIFSNSFRSVFQWCIVGKDRVPTDFIIRNRKTLEINSKQPIQDSSETFLPQLGCRRWMIDYGNVGDRCDDSVRCWWSFSAWLERRDTWNIHSRSDFSDANNRGSTWMKLVSQKTETETCYRTNLTRLWVNQGDILYSMN